MADELESLLSAEACPTRCGRDANKPVAEKDPIAELRGLFCERMVPLVLEIAERHRPKGVTVSMDASGFLDGGRTIRIDIEFRGHRLCMEGTVMPGAIAFHESRFTPDQGGTVAGGPTLRARQLTEEGFSEFIYQRIIGLVKSAMQNARG